MYTDGGVGGVVEHNVGVVNVPAGGTTIADLTFKVPGTYVIVDTHCSASSMVLPGRSWSTGQPRRESSWATAAAR